MSCFSVRQIEQIENGEGTSFYGAQNKLTAAKKVAALLKLKEEDAFDFSNASPAPKSAPAKETDSEESPAQNDLPLEKKSKTSKVVETKAAQSKPVEMASTKSFDPISNSGSSKSKKPIDPKKKLFVLLGIAAALVFSVVNLRPLFFPEPAKEEILVVEEVVQAPAPEEKSDAATPAPAPAATPAPTAAAPAAATSTECPTADASALTYKPDAPKKAGDMVYAQSKTAQTICVIDAAGKTQTKQLEPGVGVSIYGKPPLKVLTGGLNQVDLFYQGAKVRLGNTSAKTIVLDPAELSQPAAPANSDSQLR